MPEPISSLLLPQAANNRHGLVFNPQTAVLSKSDVPDVVHVGVPYSMTNIWKSASGGVARNKQDATLAAIGEGVERYSAAISRIPLKSKNDIVKERRVDAEDWTLFSDEQRLKSDFPFGNLYSNKCLYTNVYRLSTQEEYWIPHPLVVLRDDYETGIPTSSGLATAPTANDALLRATQELIERDSLMATWQHSLPGRALKIPTSYEHSVAQLSGEIGVFDLTPHYSPFPVIAVAGGIPKRGRWRYSLGVACRTTITQATEKAFLEWCQGVYFAGVYPKYVDMDNLMCSAVVSTFDEHAMYYTYNAKLWPRLPFFANRTRTHKPAVTGISTNSKDELATAIKALDAAGIRLLYRDLTTIDALQSGVRVVRVLSPDLIPINSHHNWPFMGGSAANVKLRFPWVKHSTVFPNPYPHPLG